MTVYRTGPETLRLAHRALTVADAEVFFALNSHPGVMRFTGEVPLRSLDEARGAIERYPDFDAVGYGRWGCVLKETGLIIGFCGLKYLPELDEVDLGYRFFPEYWGRGLATEACIASLEFGFRTLGLDRIIALVLPENAASIRVLEKVGMHATETVVDDGRTVLRYVIRRVDVR